MNYLKFKTLKPGIMVFVVLFFLLLETELFIGNESHQSLAEKENPGYRGEIWPTGCNISGGTASPLRVVL